MTGNASYELSPDDVVLVSNVLHETGDMALLRILDQMNSTLNACLCFNKVETGGYNIDEASPFSLSKQELLTIIQGHSPIVL